MAQRHEALHPRSEGRKGPRVAWGLWVPWALPTQLGRPVLGTWSCPLQPDSIIGHSSHLLTSLVGCPRKRRGYSLCGKQGDPEAGVLGATSRGGCMSGARGKRPQTQMSVL